MNQLDYLLSPVAIRERSQQIFDLVTSGNASWTYHPEKWDQVVEFVDRVIDENYPNGDIPFHSRLGHFRPGGIDRTQILLKEWSHFTQEEKAQGLIDLIIPSVLLDAGAGAQWTYHEKETDLRIGRSEGLGLASLELFKKGWLSDERKAETNARGLQSLTVAKLEEIFQVTEKNPLIGVAGRLELLQRLGLAIEKRPGEFLKSFLDQSGKVDALLVLSTLLRKLGPIWPSRFEFEGVPLGDTWSHSKLGAKGSFASFVPFHKLSQWMSYSLLDALQVVGYELKNVDRLTGLPEYRNGGLFLDLGLIQAKNPQDLTRGVRVDEEFTIEWRALTIILLDQLALKLQQKRGLTTESFPLAKVLEGGSWWAGRKIAKELRPDQSSPIQLISDGTVF